MAKRGPYRKQKERPPLAEYLYSERKEKGLTQEEVARKLHKKKSSISRIESGERRQQCLHGYILYRLAKAYGVSPGEVLKRANWPQLLLIGASEEEKEQLIHYLKEAL